MTRDCNKHGSDTSSRFMSSCGANGNGKKGSRKKNKSRSKSAGSKKGPGKDSFGRKVCPERAEKITECHESVKKFFSKDKGKDKITKNKDETKIEERDAGIIKTSDDECEKTSKTTGEKNECTFIKWHDKDKANGTGTASCCTFFSEKSSKHEKSPGIDTSKPLHDKDQSNGTGSCGPLSEEKSSKSSGEESQSENENSREKKSASAKKDSFCKGFGKKYVTFDPQRRADIDLNEGFKMPEPQVMTSKPCLPRVEKSTGVQKKRKPCCISTDICPQLKKSHKGEFFCIDARDMKMNDCIKKYMTLDPSQVNKKCSAFAEKKMHTLTHPPRMPPVRGSGMLLPPRSRQMMGRWAPTAGLYMATTAILTVWVTEWKDVLKYVPFYKEAADGGSDTTSGTS